MTPPRYNEPGQTCFVTVEAASRTLRFLPTREVRDSIDFLFALLVANYRLLVHEFLFMGNHFHLVVTDPDGELSNFLRDFDSMLSAQLNALRGGSGRNFEDGPGVLRITDGATVVEKAIYTLVNPCAAHLVERLRHWKASSSLNLAYGETVTIKRPNCGIWKHSRGKKSKRQGQFPSAGRLKYRGRSKAPEEVSFTLARPDVMPELSDVELRQYIRERGGERERELIAERRQTGQKVLGWRNIFRHSYLETPQSFRVLFQRRPRVTGQDPGPREAMLATIRRFEAKHRRAVEAMKNGDKDVVFPYGTLQMVQRYNVRCAAGPP